MATTAGDRSAAWSKWADSSTASRPAAAPRSPPAPRAGQSSGIDPSSGAFTVLHAFSDLGATPAWYPWGPLALGPDGMLYGLSLRSARPADRHPTRCRSRCSTRFHPRPGRRRAPPLSADGFLYGTTRFGGATGRGRVYRLSRETGAVTLLGTLPGGPVQTASAWNSPLVAGPDGLLYGTSHSKTDTVSESRIVRVDPATGAASAAHAAHRSAVSVRVLSVCTAGAPVRGALRTVARRSRASTFSASTRRRTPSPTLRPRRWAAPGRRRGCSRQPTVSST